ncbi:MAG: hypothetical protein IKQ29_03690 [Bacilli bacterium]|nr:hypothetical protein [Bacilli bacterium]
MGYGWSVDSLRKSLERLKRIVDKSSSLEEKFYYTRVYGETLEIVHRFVNEALPTREPSLNEKIQELTNTVFTERCFYALVEQVYDRVDIVDDFTFNATKAINKRKLIEPSFTLDTGSYIGNERTLSMVGDFYKRLDPDLYDVFKHIYKRRHSSFDFVTSPNGEYTSECFLIDGPKDFYVNIVNNYGVKKYCDTIHECGHVIEFLMNPRICYNDNPNYFKEVASIFPELVAFYEGFQGKDKDEYLYQFFCSLAATLDELASLMHHDPISSAWVENGYRMNKNFYGDLRHEFDISRNDVKTALDVKIGSVGIYITSLATSLELLHIYKRDKKEALRLFKQLLLVNNNMDINAQYMSLVPFTDGMVEELGIFKDEFSLLLERKGVKL